MHGLDIKEGYDKYSNSKLGYLCPVRSKNNQNRVVVVVRKTARKGVRDPAQEH